MCRPAESGQNQTGPNRILHHRVRSRNLPHTTGLPPHWVLPPNMRLHSRTDLRGWTLRLARITSSLLPSRQTVFKDRSRRLQLKNKHYVAEKTFLQVCCMLCSLENYYWRYTSASELVNMILAFVETRAYALFQTAEFLTLSESMVQMIMCRWELTTTHE